jgi:hypothetical protein
MVSDGQAALRGLGAALLWIYTCRYLHHSDQLVRFLVVWGGTGGLVDRGRSTMGLTD